jgi:aryl-alcohol dehydrogenase-like predicted oxidoreductase
MKDLFYIRWRDNRVSRIVLGTAQLGMHYGIANMQGQPTGEQAREIINAAWQQGITFFDTAQAYGNSEDVLGKVLRQLGIADDANIISKLSPDLDLASTTAIKQAIDNSCKRLGSTCLWGMLLHRAEWLFRWGEGLGDALYAARDNGRIKYIGVSVYSVAEAHRALEHPAIDVIQIPCNAWDQRMKTAGIFEIAKSMDKLCFIRSIYLQGLLALSPESVAARLPHAQTAARKWHKLAAQYNIAPVTFAMRFARSLDLPLVIGAETLQQLRDNISLLKEAPLENKIIESIQRKMSLLVNDSILNPSQWNRET